MSAVKTGNGPSGPPLQPCCARPARGASRLSEVTVAECSHCGRTLLVGGRSIDGRRYCRPACAQSASDRRRGGTGARRESLGVRARLALRAVPDLRSRRPAGGCPCVASRRVAAVRHALGDATPCVLPALRPQEAGGRAAGVGRVRLVGVPWGLVLTPIQLVRNALGLAARDGGRDAAVRTARAAQAGGAPAAARTAGRRRLSARPGAPRAIRRPAARSPMRPSARRWPC